MGGSPNYSFFDFSIILLTLGTGSSAIQYIEDILRISYIVLHDIMGPDPSIPHSTLTHS